MDRQHAGLEAAQRRVGVVLELAWLDGVEAGVLELEGQGIVVSRVAVAVPVLDEDPPEDVDGVLDAGARPAVGVELGT